MPRVGITNNVATSLPVFADKPMRDTFTDISDFVLINWTSPFPSLGLLGRICHCIQLFRHFCKQKVKNLIRHNVLRRLSRFSTVCGCPTKRTLGLYGLDINQGCILRIV